MILELFTKTKYDNYNILKDRNDVYSLKTIKKMVANKVMQIKDCAENIILLPDDNFGFIINFFASIFAKKNIYLLTEKQKIKELQNNFYIADNKIETTNCDYSFPSIEAKDVIINFFTSGSTKEAQNIKKSLWNLIQEGIDVTVALNLANKDLTIKSSTTFCHLFGMTFGLMFPLCNKYTIDTERVLYPENIDNKNCFFVSTPAFLTALKKHSLPFTINPQYIIAAGAKLNNDVFEYFENNSSVIEIYGSTETGVMAYRTKSTEKELTTFPNVKFKNENTIISNYIYEKETIISDNIEINKNRLTVLGRKDRILKIYDKRVSLEAVENSLNNNELVEESYCFELKNKLACICVLNKEGKNYLLEKGINELKKHLKSYLKEYTEVVPQKWHFNNCIPTTQTGKIDKAYINKIFTVNFSFPVILDAQIIENSITYTIFFNKNCNFYNGHFPNYPITPGVAQLYLASELASQYFNLNTGIGQIKKIKFSNIIHPNTIVNLSLTKTNNGIEYSYFKEDTKYSSGLLPIKNVFKGEVQ